MILDGRRVFLFLVCLSASAAPAGAQYTRTGLLHGGFDDMTANSGAGRVHVSQWAQDYKLDIDGPLFHPILGDMHDGFAYSEGASINQTANTGIPRLQTISFMTRADCFTPWLRQLIRFSPNYSRGYTHQSGDVLGRSYANTVAYDSWGGATGLSLPRLPSVGYARQMNTLRDPSALNPIFQRSTTENKNVGYAFGHIVTNASQETSNVQDQGSPLHRVTELRRAALEANYYELKRVPLQSFYFRSDFNESLNNGAMNNEQGGANFNLSTRKFKTGRWESYVLGGSNASRNFLRDSDVLSENAAVNSKRLIRDGNIGNALSATHSPSAPSESVADLLNFNRYLLRGLLNANLGGSGGWGRTPSLTTLTDGLSGRLNLYPALPRNYFTEASTSGTKALRGSGGGRINHFALGANGRTHTMTMSARLDHTQSRSYASQTTSVSDQLNLLASGRPYQKLFASAGYSLGIVRNSGANESVNHSLRGNVDYYPWQGLTLSGSATYTVNAYMTAVSASYSLGRTTFKISYDRQDTSTPTSYSHLNISLSRTL